MRIDPGFGPRDENDAINGARICTSLDLCIPADGALYVFDKMLQLSLIW